MTDIADDLRVAKALIADPANWRKSAYDDLYGRMCAVGACVKAARPEAAACGDWPITTVEMALSRELPGGFTNITNFNDAESTTHADVMALFDRAIARAISKHEATS